MMMNSPSQLVHLKFVTLSNKKTQGAGRAVGQVPHKQHTNPHFTSDPASVQKGLGREAPYLSQPGKPGLWQSPGRCERRIHMCLRP